MRVDDPVQSDFFWSAQMFLLADSYHFLWSNPWNQRVEVLVEKHFNGLLPCGSDNTVSPWPLNCKHLKNFDFALFTSGAFLPQMWLWTSAFNQVMT